MKNNSNLVDHIAAILLKIQLFSSQIFRRVWAKHNQWNYAASGLIPIISTLLFIFYTSFACVVYQQFHIGQIIACGLIFGIIPLALAIVFSWRRIIFNINFSLSNILFSGFVFFYIVAFLANEPEWLMKYYPTYPILQADIGQGWHEDSVFHVSIIQSIINFGYPSTGQHGVPFIPYHVLSHYMDALIIKITGVHPYDSYGMFFHFKKMAMALSVILAVGIMAGALSKTGFVVGVIVGIPLLFGTWHLIGSHGLWFTSVLLVCAFSRCVEIIAKPTISWGNAGFLLFIGILLALGKISTGFTFALFVGIGILLKYPKSIKTYILGALWCVFFVVYSSSFHVEPDNASQYNSYNLFDAFIESFRTASFMGLPSQMYLMLLILLILYLAFRCTSSLLFLTSGVTTFTLVGVLTAFLAIDQGMRFYFFQALYQILALCTLFLILKYAQNIKSSIVFIRDKTQVAMLFPAYTILIGAILYSLVGHTILLPTITKIPQSLLSMNLLPFRQLALTSHYDLSVSGLLQGRGMLHLGKDQQAPFSLLKNKFENQLEERQIKKNECMIFFTRDSLREFDRYNVRNDWSTGMFLYSLLGSPLLNAVPYQIKYFGFSKYNPESLTSDSQPSTQDVQLNTNILHYYNDAFRAEEPFHKRNHQ